MGICDNLKCSYEETPTTPLLDTKVLVPHHPHEPRVIAPFKKKNIPYFRFQFKL